MASFLAKIWARLNQKRVPLTIMIVGLDNSGKTSILNTLTSSNVSRPSATAHPPPPPPPPSRPRSQSPDEPDDNFGGDPEIDRLFQGEDDFSRLDQQQQMEFSDATKYDRDFLLLNDCPPSATPTGRESSGNMLFNLTGSDRQAKSSGGGGGLMPTVGYDFERIQFRSLQLTVLDFSGQTKYRSLWQEFYNAVDGIVFVIDSSDLIRLVVARDELENMLSHPYFATLNGGNNNNCDNHSRHSRLATTPLEHIGPTAPPTGLDNTGLRMALAQKQLTISQGKLIQKPLNTIPLAHAQQQQTRQRVKSAPKVAASTSKSLKLANNSSLALFHSLSSTPPDNEQQQQQAGSVGRQRTQVPILFLANKADLANSVKTEVIARVLNLNQLPVERHPWFIQATSVTGANSQGVMEAFDWLTNQLSLATTTTAAP